MLPYFCYAKYFCGQTEGLLLGGRAASIETMGVVEQKCGFAYAVLDIVVLLL